MAPVTVRHSAKPWAWSYSKLKNFDTCPKRYYEIDIAKTYKEEKTEQLAWGDTAHAVLAARIGKGTPMPPGMEYYDSWCERVLTGGGNILVEQKLAITKDFGPCGYFDREVWFRSVADVLKIIEPVALAIDWKTGKIVEDSVQLALMAQCVFAHHPGVQKIRTEFVWLKEDATTREDFTRDDMAGLWRTLWPRIEALKSAHDAMTYPPKPGGLCRKYCVVTSCPYHGKGG